MIRYSIVMAEKGTTIWLSGPEYLLLRQGKDLLEAATNAKLSWGAYLCAISFGALASQALTGVLAECPNCGYELKVKMVKPKAQG